MVVVLGRDTQNYQYYKPERSKKPACLHTHLQIRQKIDEVGGNRAANRLRYGFTKPPVPPLRGCIAPSGPDRLVVLHQRVRFDISAPPVQKTKQLDGSRVLESLPRLRSRCLKTLSDSTNMSLLAERGSDYRFSDWTALDLCSGLNSGMVPSAGMIHISTCGADRYPPN